MCIRDSGNWINALADLVERHMAGWPTKTPIDPKALEISASEAIKFGARS